MSERHAVSAGPKVYVREKLSPTAADRFDARPENLPTDLNTAYARLRDATRRDAGFGAAWKLGGTTPVTRAAFNVERVYFGPLHEREIHSEPQTVRAGHLCELKGEVEIALRLSAAISRVSDDELRTLRPEGAETLFDAWCIALEMPASAIRNLPAAGVNALIADRLTGALVLGAARPLADRAWQEQRDIVLAQDGEEISCGSAANLVASPVQCAVDFVVEARAYGFGVRSGQWISTGGLTPCVPLAIGARVTVRHGAEAALDFVLNP